jgi:hypothetical protein
MRTVLEPFCSLYSAARNRSRNSVQKRLIMKRNLMFILLAVVLSSAVRIASADEVVKCESRGGRQRCGYRSEGRVELQRQLSISSCEEGSSWGARDGEIWVDHGCRAEFLITSHRRREREREARTIICESDGGRHRCSADIRGEVRLERQLSHRDCVKGSTWGYDADGIWVRDGCRGEFLVEERRGDRDRDDNDRRDRNRHEARERVVTCESKDGKRHRCEVETGFGVKLVRQLSVSECKFRDSWGYDDRGIWVRAGCRAEFSVRTR